MLVSCLYAVCMTALVFSLPRVSDAMYRILKADGYNQLEAEYLHGKLMTEILDQLERMVPEKMMVSTLYGKMEGE